MKRFCIFLFFFSFHVVFAQQETSNRLYNDAVEEQSSNLQERLFVHTDKTSYTAGEIVWFKLYDVEAATHKPLDVSKVGYVEIVSRDDKPVLQAKVRMQNGSGSGSFLLPFSLTSDNYVLKAYTAWMKNFSPEYFFETPLTIINTLKKTEVEDKSDSVSYDVRFFPEGGDLVSGLQSNIAFKGVDRWGRSMAFTGYILNNKNDTLIKFQPLRLGMGAFSFTPITGEAYKAVVKTEGYTFTKPFPIVYPDGYVMAVKPSGKNQLSVSVAGNRNLSDSFVYLLIQSGRLISAVQVKVLLNGKAEFVVDRDSLAEGISRFTIYNSARKPLCERLYCRQPKQKLNIDVTTDAKVYADRKKVILSIGIDSDSLRIAEANLSVSVFHLDSLQQFRQPDIFSYLWLGSEIKGTIESPDTYLMDSSAIGQQALDNLMLTQGWRRFRTDDGRLSEKTSFHFLPEYEGQIITANITQKATGLPAPGITAYLSIPGRPFQFSTSVSDDSGQLVFSLNHFFGAGQAIIQTSDTIDNLYQITVNNSFAQTPAYTHPVPFQLLEKWRDELLRNSIAVQTQNAYLFEKRQRFTLSDEVDTTVFYGMPDKHYLLDDYTRFPTMEEVMREYVTEVRVNKSGDNYQFAVDNLPYRTFFKNKPLILLDGVPVWNTNRVISYDPLQVKQLDIITHKYYLGSKTYDGIVSYLTYNGEGAGIELNPSTVQFDYEGLQLKREFYSPVYETPQQVYSRIPDFRNTLLWSPDLITNVDGKQTLAFYTSDIAGDYEIVVQGNTGTGLTGSKRIYISVKK